MTKQTEQSEQSHNEQSYWISTWSQAQRGMGIFPVNDNGHTVEYMIPIQNSGRKIRLKLGNYYNENLLTIGAVSVAINGRNSFQSVVFNGLETTDIVPFSSVQSDPCPLEVYEGDQLTIRIYYPENKESNRAVSGNTLTKQQVRSVKGNFTVSSLFSVDDVFADVLTDDPLSMTYAEGFNEQKVRFGLTIEEVSVQTTEAGGTIVAFGDSITEQSHWVSPTQERVRSTLGNGYSLVNAGISGNRLLKDIASFPVRAQFFGRAAIERFIHDVYETHENVRGLIIALGVNDLHQPGTGPQFPVEELPTFEQMIEGYQQLIDEAKQRQTSIYFTTITPFIGYAEDVKNEEKEFLRQKLNTWIRENQEIEGVYDFDKIIANPNDPQYLDKQYDSGDKLHPNSLGGQEMSKIIDVRQWR